MTEKTIDEKRTELSTLMKHGHQESEAVSEIEETMQQLHEKALQNDNIRDIEYSNGNYPYHIVISGLKEQYTKDHALRFLINKNKTLKGKIVNRIEEGIIKLRCICEKDNSFEANDEDYQNFADIVQRMVKNWKNGCENTRFQHREGRFQ